MHRVAAPVPVDTSYQRRKPHRERSLSPFWHNETEIMRRQDNAGLGRLGADDDRGRPLATGVQRDPIFRRGGPQRGSGLDRHVGRITAEQWEAPGLQAFRTAIGLMAQLVAAQRSTWRS